MVAAWGAYRQQLKAALDNDDHAQALRLFMQLAGSSDEDIAGAEAAPVWTTLLALAPTLRYDAACLGDGPPSSTLAMSRTQHDWNRSWRRSMRTARCDEIGRSTSVLPRTG